MSGRVLVTGASGFIGSRTLAPLRQAGFAVHSFGRTAPREPTTHHPGDLFDHAQVRAVLGSVAPTHILHCAWEVTHGTFWHDNFGRPMSHGCVNLSTPMSEWLYGWARIGTIVWVHNL